MKTSFVLSALIALGASQAWPDPIIYANNAGTDRIEVIDAATGTVLDSFVALAANGRGVVTIGNTVYFTQANSGSVYSADLTTHAFNGVAFQVAGATGLSTIAYDGTNFWIGDYSGTNRAYHYTPTGGLLGIINLPNAQGFYDGLEYFNGKLIANRFDGGFGGTNTYDIYDLNGNLLTPAFITTTQSPASTGIAYDGANFWVAGVSDGKLYEYNGTTGAFITSIQVQGTHAFEDLSVNYANRPDTGAPEPSTWLMMSGPGLLLIFLRSERVRKVRGWI